MEDILGWNVKNTLLFSGQTCKVEVPMIFQLGNCPKNDCLIELMKSCQYGWLNFCDDLKLLIQAPIVVSLSFIIIII